MLNTFQRCRIGGKALRPMLVLAVLVTGISIPVAMASPRVGVSIHFSVPPRIHVHDAVRYEPYYVGRVFYRPANAWRFVYSFPIETDYGVVYRPYVYGAGGVVCHDFIPGPELGYGGFVIEGRGHYEPRWYHGHGGWSDHRSHAYRDHAERGRGHGGWDDDRHAHGYGHGDRGRGDSRGHGHRH